jgi:sulfofructose kinase
MTARIICVGIAVLDQIYAVGRLPIGDGKNFATGYREVGGGPAATAAVAVARLGGEAELWTRLGDDGNGNAILAEIKAYGVETGSCRRFAGAASNCSAVAVDPDGARMIIAFADSTLPTDPSWLPAEHIGKAGGILGDMRWPEGTAHAFEAAIEIGVPRILDADAVPEGTLRTPYGLASHVLFSRPGLEAFTGDARLAEGMAMARNRLEGWIAVTDGGNGTWWYDRSGKLTRTPAFRVPVVDTLGAGDVFHGAFALTLATGFVEDAAIRYAQAVAALKCTKSGGRAGIPSAADVDNFLGEQAG